MNPNQPTSDSQEIVDSLEDKNLEPVSSPENDWFADEQQEQQASASVIKPANHGPFWQNFLQRPNIGLIATFSGFFLLTLALVLYLSPWATVQKIKVDTTQINYQTVLDEAKVSVGQNRALVVGQEQTIKNRIKNPKIKDISMNLSGNVLKVDVTENIIYGYVFQDGHWSQLTKDGKIKSQVDQPTNETAVFSNFKIGSKMLGETIKSYFKIDPNIRVSVSQIIFAPNSVHKDRVALIMNDGNMVYARHNQLHEKMGYYSQMVATMQGNDIQNGVIDLTGDGFARAISENDRDLIEKSKNADKFEEYKPSKKEDEDKKDKKDSKDGGEGGEDQSSSENTENQNPEQENSDEQNSEQNPEQNQ